MADVQTRNDRIAELQALQEALTALRAIFPASRSTGVSFDPAMPQAHAAVSRTAAAAGVTGLATTTIGGLEAARATVSRLVDAASSGQQMDVLRLQALSNKRNEAFALMTDFIERMQDARASIIGNLR